MAKGNLEKEDNDTINKKAIEILKTLIANPNIASSEVEFFSEEMAMRLITKVMEIRLYHMMRENLQIFNAQYGTFKEDLEVLINPPEE